MIQSIQIGQFKSYEEASLPLAPLTVLIGANASGKSNALEALRFLSWLAQGQRLSSLQYQVNEAAQVVRGRVVDLPRRGSETFTLGCHLQEVEFSQLTLKIRLQEERELHIHHEAIKTAQGYALYETVYPSEGAGSDMTVAYNNFAAGGKKPQIPFYDQAAIFSQMVSVAPALSTNTNAKEKLSQGSAAFEKALTHILFLDPKPANMRAYSYLADKQLFEDGRNLSAVLYHLWNDEGQAEANRSRILSFIASLPEQDITAVSFLNGPKGEVLVELTESFGGTDEVCDATLLSDGTLRVLAIAAIMLSAPEGSLVVIEEIGNGIHPSRAHHLLAEINQIARDRNLRILISTHNPALLNALPIESIGDVVFCYRDPDDGSSKLSSLQKLPDYPELISRASLGDLLTTGLLEKFVKTYEGPGAKKEKALAWLASMSK